MKIKFNISRFAEEGDKVVSQKALRSYHEKMRNLLKQSQGDWNENNENKLNYVKNRPFYSKGYITEEKESSQSWDADNNYFEIYDSTSYNAEMYYAPVRVSDGDLIYTNWVGSDEDNFSTIVENFENWLTWDNISIDIFDRDFNLSFDPDKDILSVNNNYYNLYCLRNSDKTISINKMTYPGGSVVGIYIILNTTQIGGTWPWEENSAVE